MFSSSYQKQTAVIMFSHELCRASGAETEISGSHGGVPCLECFGCVLGPSLVIRDGIYGIKVKFYMGQEMGWSL